MARTSKPIKQEDQIEQLLRQNLELNERIFELTKKTNKYIISVQILSILKIVLILAPIILAVIYLPPFLKEAFSGYTEMLNVDMSQFKNILQSK